MSIANVVNAMSVLVGQRFRDRSRGVFGSLKLELVVREIYRGVAGVEYARLVLASDHSVTKTIAVSVLEDRRRYAPVESE